MNTIKWSQSAYISFEEIIKYSIEEHGIRQANRLKKGLHQRMYYVHLIQS